MAEFLIERESLLERINVNNSIIDCLEFLLSKSLRYDKKRAFVFEITTADLKEFEDDGKDDDDDEEEDDDDDEDYEDDDESEGKRRGNGKGRRRKRKRTGKGNDKGKRTGRSNNIRRVGNAVVLPGVDSPSFFGLGPQLVTSDDLRGARKTKKPMASSSSNGKRTKTKSEQVREAAELKDQFRKKLQRFIKKAEDLAAAGEEPFPLEGLAHTGSKPPQKVWWRVLVMLSHPKMRPTGEYVTANSLRYKTPDTKEVCTFLSYSDLSTLRTDYCVKWSRSRKRVRYLLFTKLRTLDDNQYHFGLDPIFKAEFAPELKRIADLWEKSKIKETKEDD
jgi:hypothetical protein